MKFLWNIFLGEYSCTRAAVRYPAEVTLAALHREDLANLYARAPLET
jgi:hypothetical protein